MSDTPIVLIHGIKGSQLAQSYDDSFDVVWSGLQKRFESVQDLTLDDAGAAERDPFHIFEVQRIEAAAYGECVGRLRREFADVPVYIFRYDWRYDLAGTAGELDGFLKRLSRKTGAKRFRFVTHSMGALVLAAFLKKAKRNPGRVERAVFAAPPFWGAVEAVRMLVVGEAALFGIHGSERFRKIARTFPAAYQLVPSYPEVWKHPHDHATIWDVRYWQHRVEMDGRDEAIYDTRADRMQRHLSRARIFHKSDLQNLDALAADERAKLLVLYGTGEKTRVRIPVREHNSSGEVRYFFDFEDDAGIGDGDGTVPSASATRFSEIRQIPVPLGLFSPWWPTYWDDQAKIQALGFHPMFLGLDKVQGLVVDWLAGRDPKADWVKPIVP